MGRLKELQNHVDYELELLPDPKLRLSAAAHLYGVCLASTILASRRGLDPELAAMAAMLHDLHAYRSGSYEDHAAKGAVLAREILETLRLTTPEETDLICSAIAHHDSKLDLDGPLDEVLKDADVVHHCMNDLSKPVKDKERPRFQRLCRELGMTPPEG